MRALAISVLVLTSCAPLDLRSRAEQRRDADIERRADRDRRENAALAKRQAEQAERERGAARERDRSATAAEARTETERAAATLPALPSAVVNAPVPVIDERDLASAALCFFAEARAHQLGEIAKLKKYAAIGGVIDMGKVNAAQNYVRRADEGEARARKVLGKRKPIACASKPVALLRSCYVAAFYGEDPDGCYDLKPAVARAQELVPELSPGD